MPESEAVAAPAEVESASLSDHEQAFAPPALAVPEPRPSRSDPGDEDDAAQEERDTAGRFKTRQRARSQAAGPDDVETIQALTKRLRDAEDALGVKVERKAGESDRVFNLRRRAELAEARRDAVKPVPEPPPIPVVEPKTFDEKEPRYEDFANAPDQYAAHLRAVAAYDRRKEAFEGSQASSEETRNKAIAERNAQRDKWYKDQETAHGERMRAYHEANPSAQAALEAAGDVKLTPATYMAVMTAENGPALLMRLANDEDLRDDVFDLTDGKTLSEDLVARVQRRLNRGLTAGRTGSAPVPIRSVPAVPRPPNPVRTGPMKTDDAPPGDEDSLAAHEKYYGSRRR